MVFLLILPVALPFVRRMPSMPASVQKVPCERTKYFQLVTVLGFHSMCPERERNRELNLTEFPFLSIVAIYFTHFSFKGRNKKSLWEGTGSILRNSLSDKIRTIINLAAYELNANFAFQLDFPTTSAANFPHFVQQLKPSPTTQTSTLTNNL